MGCEAQGFREAYRNFTRTLIKVLFKAPQKSTYTASKKLYEEYTCTNRNPDSGVSLFMALRLH